MISYTKLPNVSIRNTKSSARVSSHGSIAGDCLTAKEADLSLSPCDAGSVAQQWEQLDLRRKPSSARERGNETDDVKIQTLATLVKYHEIPILISPVIG